MEQILNKLSEIEITAQRIMEDAGRSKAALSAEMEQQCRITSSWRKTYSNSFSDTERGDPIWEDSFPTAEYQQRSVPCRVN